MKILIVSNHFPPSTVGGAEIVAYRQAIAFREAGHAVTVFCGYVSEEEPGFLLNEVYCDLPVYRCRLLSLEKDADFYWGTAGVRFQSILNYIQPDIVHFHNVSGLGVYLVTLCRAANIPSFVTLHDYWGLCLRNTLLKNNNTECQDTQGCATCMPRIPVGDQASVPIRLRRDYIAFCLSHATALISPSNFLAEVYSKQRQIQCDTYVISNGIGIRPIETARQWTEKTSKNDFVGFVCFAHLGPHKGIFCLIEALRILIRNSEMIGRWKIYIAGQGSEDFLVKNLIAESAVAADHVIFCGKLKHEDALKLLDDCDVQVLTSIWPENEPVSILEAIERGKTQIASRIGGIPELIEHEQSGFLFDPGDHCMLANMMANFINNPAQARRYGIHNLSVREKYNERVSINSILALFRDAMLSQLPIETDQGVKQPSGRRFVIACYGLQPPTEVDLILANFHRAEMECIPISFVWSGWVQNDLWKEVDAVWIWSDDEQPPWDIILRALRSGLPILSAVGSRIGLISRSVDPDLAYTTWQEAFEILASLPALSVEIKAQAQIRKRLADTVSALLEKRNFSMRIGTL